MSATHDSPAVTVTGSNFSETVGGAGVPVLVDFWAKWCGPCRMLGPVLEDLASENAGKALVAKVDIDTEQELARQFSIRSVPTVMVFVDGQVQATIVGVRPKGEYQSFIDRAVA